MKTELYARWVKALRETDKPYHRDVLRTEAGAWSPLGLLADIIDPRGWEQCRQWHFWRWRGQAVGLTRETQEAAGISPDAMRGTYNLQNTCTTFAEFADRLKLFITPERGEFVAPPAREAKPKGRGGRRPAAPRPGADLPGLS